MDFDKMNRILDMFMRSMYGVDAYLTPISRFTPIIYRPNILFFPSKFLKGSSEYSEKYYKFFNRDGQEIEDDIFKAFKYLGVNSENIDRGSTIIHISSDIPEYLKNYQRELIVHINDFIESDTIKDYRLSEAASNFRVDSIDSVAFLRGRGDSPYINFKIIYDSKSFYNMASLLNSWEVRNPLMDYLSTKMKVDPQIGFYFDGRAR
jgi:hypothetical protein